LFEPPNRLHVRGVFQGEIRAVSPSTTSHAQVDYPAVLELVSLHLPHITREECLDWYVWVMTGGNLNRRWHGHSATPSLQEAKKILQQLWSGEDLAVAPIYRNWYAWNLTDQRPGRFFVTDRGQLGCGSPTIVPGDKVCVVLGCDHPILLRPAHSDDQSACYHYMGPLYVHGLMEGQALLGPMPPPWELIINNDTFRDSFAFLNLLTNEITLQDPRLDVLPPEWHEIDEEWETSFIHTQHYRNKTTGDIINSDPRLLPEALEARGVPLETFTLV
jgi:hypothetical protein